MAEAEAQRINIGFDGGQSLALKLDADLTELRQALSDGGWYELIDTEGRTVLIDLRRVVFIRIEPSEYRVGFGSSS